MSTRVALLFSFLDRYASLIVNIISSMLIARLLTPAQIGVFSVTMVLLSFLQALRDFGAGQYLLKERDLTPEKLRAVWTIQLGVGAGFGLLIAAMAAPVAGLYASPGMQPIMYVIAFNFLLAPFGSLTYAWLTREMRFANIAVARFVSVSGGALVSIGLAWNGWGAISLAWGTLASTLLNIAATLPFRPLHFPLLPTTRGLRDVFRFGGAMAGTALTNAASGGAPELILGKTADFAVAAFYSRSNGLVTLFNRLILDAVMPVVTAHLSAQVRKSGDIDGPYQLASLYILTCAWSFSGLLAFNAGPAVNLLYGAQWLESARVLPYFCVALGLGMTNAMAGAALIAHGRSAALFRTTLMDGAQAVLLFALTGSFGIDALCVGLVASRVIGILIWSRALEHETGIATLSLLPKLLLRTSAVAIPCAIPAAWIAWRYPDAAEWLRIALSAGAGGLAFVFAASWSGHPLSAELWRLVASVIGRARRWGARW